MDNGEIERETRNRVLYLFIESRESADGRKPLVEFPVLPRKGVIAVVY